MQPFHPRWKTVDVRQLHHPLPRLHLRRMTAMPLQEKERYEATLKQKYDADGQDLPAVGFPGRRWLEKNLASRRKVLLAKSKLLHSSPVVLRRGKWNGWRLDAASLLSIEHANGDFRGQLA